MEANRPGGSEVLQTYRASARTTPERRPKLYGYQLVIQGWNGLLQFATYRDMCAN